MQNQTDSGVVKYLNLFCASLHGNWSLLFYNKEHGYGSDVRRFRPDRSVSCSFEGLP